MQTTTTTQRLVAATLRPVCAFCLAGHASLARQFSGRTTIVSDVYCERERFGDQLLIALLAAMLIGSELSEQIYTIATSKTRLISSDEAWRDQRNDFLYAGVGLNLIIHNLWGRRVLEAPWSTFVDPYRRT